MNKQQKLARDLQKRTLEKQQEEKLMEDVRLLLTNLFQREEITIKLILGCLYDVATTNLVNQKLHYGIRNNLLKNTTKISKPILKIIAWQWFIANCPQLVTNWLRSKVEFARTDITNAELLLDNLAISVPELPEYQPSDHKIKRLSFQVKLLIGLLLGTITMFSGGLVWLSYSLDKAHSANVEQLENQLRTLQSQLNQSVK
ncbi:hypothetical protein H6F32_04060 [Anabaena sp. FACHB-1237]|uniref:hypothetical protein n=1 Tax=Anabaena sp. FACHB-1237 TaxID=2692769 RepID=UPI001680A039|nr:hypothetical protein [Anabaena sp. FACHB-1237]MBD2136783.1 hypothetical protein [Anabaena sp. FACHB-1237]